jgi:hypothetical protein
MRQWSGFNLNIVLSALLLVGMSLIITALPAFSQKSTPNQQDLMVNGGFEQGFQDNVGVGYGWGAFSNGNAIVGWSADSWEMVVANGQHAQLIELKSAVEQDRYAGIYQTVAVVPGAPYKLTIKGLIRSTEGDIKVSDYGYRLQYGLDYSGGTAWELTPEQNWQELPWDEQPLTNPSNGAYRIDTFEVTVTPKSDQLTLFIRAWKKWLNEGTGLYNLDEISLVGPAPENFQATQGQVAAVGNSSPEGEIELISPALQNSEHDADLVPAEAPTAAAPPTAAPAVPQSESSQQLPVSGRGDDGSINMVVILGVIVLLALLTGAITTVRRRAPLE